jgi:hypothetical protein
MVPAADALGAEPAARDRVDPSTLKGKVMCGYQGWFNCPGDGADLGWTHWTRDRSQPPSAGNLTVDLWPDVSELSPEERYPTQLHYPDGRLAEAFSSANPKTVMRHFEWMRDYGIDGIFLQRFANGLDRGRLQAHKDRVLESTRQAAQRTGRVYAVMYDLSGLRAGQVDRVRLDWQRLSEQQRVTADPNYLHHQGRPVVTVWGVGFSDGRDYTLGECLKLVNDLKAAGCTVMLGVPSWWRTGIRDAVDDPMLQEIIGRADIVSPWTVGRYRTPEEASRHAETVWSADLQWCRDRELDFLPVLFPGFSWHNLYGRELDEIPRRKGDFLWSQVQAAKRTGCEMLYVAMFDEVDEATAIFKCTSQPPTADGVRLLDLEGLPSDFYLNMVGRAGRYLRRQE